MSTRPPSSSAAAARHWRLRPLALSLLCMGAGSAIAQLAPLTLPVIAPGAGALRGVAITAQNPAAGTMTLTQSQARAIAQWTSFSIGSGAAVNIVQPSAASVLLNRVTGGNPSEIAGQLSANGRVFLVNPSGVLFSGTAQVNVGGLVATTLDIPDASFMPSGRENTPLGPGEVLVFERGDGNAATVVNRGRIVATAGGTVLLIGAGVGNEAGGTINAPGGTAGLVSGRKVSLDFAGDGLTNVVINADALATSASAANAGLVQADGGRALMLGASSRAGQLVVNNTGVVQARSVEARNGQIVLGAGRSNTLQVAGGTVDASGTTAGRSGGSVTLSGGQVELADAPAPAVPSVAAAPATLIDVRGVAGGGTVVVAGPVINVAPSATLDASATGAGNGGSLAFNDGAAVTMAGETAPPGTTVRSSVQLAGTFNARGAGSGAGGSISATANAMTASLAGIDAGGGASGGANGRLTLAVNDPRLLVASGTTAYVAGATAVDTNRVDAAGLSRALSRGTDVTLSTSQRRDGSGVAFQNAEPETGTVAAQVVKSGGPTTTLRIDSAGSIDLPAGTAITSTGGALNVDLNADATGAARNTAATVAPFPSFSTDSAAAIRLDGARIDANGGNVRFFGQGDATNGRAVGGSYSDGASTADRWRAGVYIGNSQVLTSGTGQISLAGQGRSWASSGSYTASEGVLVTAGSTVQAGTGGLAVNGTSGVGASGVRAEGGSALTSGGAATLTGVASSSTAGQPGGGIGNTAGVLLSGARVQAQGNVALQGTGGNFDSMRASGDFTAFQSTAQASQGVQTVSSQVVAGAGARLDVTGTAGSGAFTAVRNPTTGAVTIQDGATARAIDIGGAVGSGLRAEGGAVSLQGGTGDVRLSSDTTTVALPTGTPLTAVVDVSSTTRTGGSIAIAANNVLLQNPLGTGALMDASGAGQGGRITVQGTNAVAMAANAQLRADANSATGNGGQIQLLAGRTLRAYGSLSAQGGATGGNGGAIETSGANFDVRGVRVNTGANAGTVGTWTIDPFDITIVNGNAAGTLPTNPYDAVATSTIQDGDINNALLRGNVTIGTGTGGAADQGDIFLNAAQIVFNGTGARTLTLNANRSVRSNGGASVAAYGVGSSINVAFNAAATAGSAAVGGGQVSFDGQIYTNGGTVAMNGAWTNDSNGGTSVSLGNTAVIDTRQGNALVSPGAYSGGSDAGAGGNVQLTGRSNATSTGSFITAAVNLDSTRIATASGSVDIVGTSNLGTGVQIAANTAAAGIHTTSGAVRITGVGSFVANSGNAPGHGVAIGAQFGGATSLPMVETGSGSIAVTGLRLGGGAATGGDGVWLGNQAQITSTGGGAVTVTGESRNAGGAGIRIIDSGGISVPSPAGRIQSTGQVVLRAGATGTADALVLGTGSQVSAGTTLNLRPGSVTLTGTPDTYAATGAERGGDAIALGGTSAAGFAISGDEWARLAAPTRVVGSTVQSGAITVAGALTTTGNLTLQADGGGSIALQAPLTVSGTLGLLATGDIAQTAAGGITVPTLLARSTAGSVLLDQAVNDVAASTLGGSAAGNFRYVDANTLRVGAVTANGFDAVANAPAAVTSGALTAASVLVRTTTGDLLLDTPVVSTAGTDLVAGATFQNVGNRTITGPWRIWAATWVGETRGGLVGGPTLPNLYGCTFAGACVPAFPTSGNRFIYTARPTATVTIADATRQEAQPNPAFSYVLSGLILGDTGAGITGTLATTAATTSPAGTYPINGTFASAEGYLLSVLPGRLTVTPAPVPPPPPSPPPPPPPPPPPAPAPVAVAVFTPPQVAPADVIREDVNTYTFDRNIGGPPICYATGPLGASRTAQQGDDVLAREWTRVRSRPQLTSCVDTERKNGCSDF
ncbi:filamentous hemagglutinin N-terminal domain-containing protein [Pseudacidovorax sp. RU35E]|uniref:two-partner secretion domain-containing protein n=1 Tax=Pseudacidovorax sp. RU35E TaxID=1907403 RepID=UPI0009559BC4|nr:filamentous hemagglutinin N-terminal domain-containing protein [Pseudacidovorax sp. RU35E]SIR55482.1 filamentous hemagglutinin family N-terminal domain-containing protein [Pseudacidovorax sp. RU35E]